ncbi:OadG-related small transporter subunit [Oleiharenicola lentus]|jgi:Na+-transporting methylmalonyl-CoA/oxaloacetate decarboxylase gamma subunit|uniref:OadG-related small transporter subunit n=1 Tax=Oleiharenicola lentus TaxID=2508720 RepID=UPI0013E91EB0|nr:OadG-related small transporter subunit [Oleiharenicola lentus]
MDTWTFGLTLLLVGMGGTMLTLYLLTLLIGLLTRLLPVRPEKPAGDKEGT